jgi:tetratricopeptide (TPR) repeat protein
MNFMVIYVEYIFIMLLAILITTILVFVLANSVLGIHLRWKPLFLCAVCSMVISLVLPHIVVGVAGLAGSLAVLVVFAVVFAYFVAKYDAYDEANKAPNVDEIVAAECTEQAAIQEGQDLADDQVLGQASAEFSAAEIDLAVVKAEDKLPEAGEDLVLTPIAAQFADANENSDENAAQQQDTEQRSVAGIDLAVVKAEDKLPEDSEKLVLTPIAAQYEVANENTDENAAQKQDTAKIPIEVPVIAEDAVCLAETAVEELVDEQALSDGAGDITNEKTVDEMAMAGEQIMKDKLDEIQALDDLMDYAFVQKEQNNFPQALAAFRKAFDLYADSESAPFIVIEIGNILKNKGAYDEAIQIFSEGRNLPALQYDDMLQQEFVTTIAYLRIVKNILLAQRLGFIPYNEIPGAVFAEINAEFCEWRNLA